MDLISCPFKEGETFTHWNSLIIVCFIIYSSTVFAKAVVWTAIRISLHIGVRLPHSNSCAHDSFNCEIRSCILLFITRRTYHNTRESGHSNIQWLLHDPAYTSEDIDDTVLRRLLKGLRSVSPYISRLRLAHSNRCDHDPFYCEITDTSTCYAISLHGALLPCQLLLKLLCIACCYVSRVYSLCTDADLTRCLSPHPWIRLER